ncbi:hypothetical protein [Rhodonellum sp.]|uniref:hypothetical protein n=1 Tax=Rhodonellum sp. TaxID=2231180 RepID=UPI00271A83B0|nr:hypothetical protein [Rhodonellum sp.]MDO9551487.1 hypothetical protein [Rhodonellum sp.]
MSEDVDKIIGPFDLMILGPNSTHRESGFLSGSFKVVFLNPKSMETLGDLSLTLRGWSIEKNIAEQKQIIKKNF